MATFNFTFDPGTSLQQMIGMEVAGRVWSQYLVDNVSVNIHVGVSSSLPTNVIGGALPAISTGKSYSSVRSAMSTDRKSSDDFTAVANLSIFTTQDVNFDWMTTDLLAPWAQAATKRSLTNMNLTNANAKALGVGTNGSALDGYILLGGNAPWSYDFTRSAAASTTQVDFLSTAMHEIGHVLGFISGVDDPGWTMDVYDAYYGGQLHTGYNSMINSRAQNSTTLDLFRFNYNKISYAPDLSYGNAGGWKGFSFDDGRTFIQAFSTGSNTNNTGDGEQASHWSRGVNAMMAPTISLGQRQHVSNIDLRAFDVMGWDIAANGINTAINLSTLQSQAKQALATRLTKTVTWLDANQASAAAQLGQSRVLEVANMINKSVVYNWGGGGDGWWQQVVGLFQQRSLFSTMDELNGVTARQSLGSGLGKGVDIAANFPVQDGAFPAIATPTNQARQGLSQSPNPLNNLTIEFTATSPKVLQPIVQTMTVRFDRFDLSTPKSWNGGQLASVPASSGTASREKTDWGGGGDRWW